MSTKNTYERFCVDGTEYLISPEASAAIRSGVVPPSLREEITDKQGRDTCMDICRQCRLVNLILEQIDAGKLPASIRPLVASYAVPSEILFMIYHGTLVGKSQKLVKKGLLSADVLKVVEENTLTSEIMEPLCRAFAADAAQYLYERKEITADILEGICNGSIEPRFIRLIRRSRAALVQMHKMDNKYTVPIIQDEDSPDPLNLYYSPDDQLEKGLMDTQNRSSLQEALSWLPAEERYIIQSIYLEDKSMCAIADNLGISEGTVRYRKPQILAKLRRIFEDVLHIHYEDIFN